MVHLFGLMEANIKEISRTIWDKDTDKCTGLMVIYIKANGLMANNAHKVIF